MSLAERESVTTAVAELLGRIDNDMITLLLIMELLSKSSRALNSRRVQRAATRLAEDPTSVEAWDEFVEAVYR